MYNSPHLFQSGPRKSPHPLFQSLSPPSACILILLPGRYCHLPAFGLSLVRLSPYHGCRETFWISQTRPAMAAISSRKLIHRLPSGILSSSALTALSLPSRSVHCPARLPLHRTSAHVLHMQRACA